METNLESHVMLTKLCVEHIAITKGNVVNISSADAVMAVSDLQLKATGKQWPKS